MHKRIANYIDLSTPYISLQESPDGILIIQICFLPEYKSIWKLKFKRDDIQLYAGDRAIPSTLIGNDISKRSTKSDLCRKIPIINRNTCFSFKVTKQQLHMDLYRLVGEIYYENSWIGTVEKKIDCLIPANDNFRNDRDSYLSKEGDLDG